MAPGSLRSRRRGRGLGKIGKKKGRGKEWERLQYKSPNWFSSAVAGGRKILIGQSDNWRSRPPFYAHMNILSL